MPIIYKEVRLEHR